MLPKPLASRAVRRAADGAVAASIDAYLRYTEGAVCTNTQRAVVADLKVYVAVVRRAQRCGVSGGGWHGRRFCRRHGQRAGTGYRAPLRRQHCRRALCAGVRGYGAGPGREPRAEAHAPSPRAPAEAGAGPDLGASRTSAGGGRGTANRCAEPGAGGGGPTTRCSRRSELSELQVADLVEEIQGDATLIVRRGKTDPEGRGAAVYVARDTMALVREWQVRSSVESGCLFRSLSKGGAIGTHLHPSQIPRIFKGMAQRAGLPPEIIAGLSGHSPRVGAAQDMVASGIELPAILQAGRWKTTAMVNRYGERLLARRSGAAQLARMQRRG